MTPRRLVPSLGLALALYSAPALADGNKCTLDAKPESPTAEACKRGGRKEAAREMKKMVKTAKAKGVKFVCDDCHQNLDDYKLTDNATKDYDKLLAAQK